MKKNVVYKVVGKTKRNKVVYESKSLDDCFDFILTIIRKEKAKANAKNERELQNFLDFGTMGDKK